MPQNSKIQSSNSKIVLIVMLLIFLYPVGLLLLIFWIRWGRMEKIITAFTTLGAWFLIYGTIIAPALLIAIDPIEKIREANAKQCAIECQSSENPSCVSECMEQKLNPSQQP